MSGFWREKTAKSQNRWKQMFLLTLRKLTYLIFEAERVNTEQVNLESKEQFENYSYTRHTGNSLLHN